MHDELNALLELAHEDEKWLHVRQAAEALPKKLAALEHRLVGVKRAAEEALRALEATRLERRKLEGQVQDVTVSMQKLESQLPQLKTNDAYRAMLHEIDGAKSKRSELETRVLECFEREERQVGLQKDAEASAGRDQQTLTAERKVLEAERAERDAELARVEAARAALIAKLSPAVKARYERLFANRPGHAVAPVNRSACGACHANLPPQLLAEVKRRDAMHVCEECGRILVWAEA